MFTKRIVHYTYNTKYAENKTTLGWVICWSSVTIKIGRGTISYDLESDQGNQEKEAQIRKNWKEWANVE